MMLIGRPFVLRPYDNLAMNRREVNSRIEAEQIELRPSSGNES